jgi:dTDP-4-dehydrorhamnose reductase
MKILITGSNGFLGTYLTEIGANRAVEMVCSARQRADLPYPVFEYLDITDPVRLKYLLDLHQPDVLINTAAMSKPDACQKNKTACYAVNFTAVKTLADVCFQKGVHLIHLSSDFVYDGRHGLYSEEDIPENPVNYYGQCKLDAEKCIVNSPVKSAIVRTCLVYGYPLIPKASNLFTWVKSSLEKGERIQVVNDQFRTPTLVTDLADAVLKLAERKAEGIWHVSGDEYLSVYEFACRIASAFDLPLSRIQPVASASLNQAAMRPPKTGFRINKAMREINYHPHNISNGLDVLHEHTNPQNGN